MRLLGDSASAHPFTERTTRWRSTFCPSAGFWEAALFLILHLANIAKKTSEERGGRLASLALLGRASEGFPGQNTTVAKLFAVAAAQGAASNPPLQRFFSEIQQIGTSTRCKHSRDPIFKSKSELFPARDPVRAAMARGRARSNQSSRSRHVPHLPTPLRLMDLFWRFAKMDMRRRSVAVDSVISSRTRRLIIPSWVFKIRVAKFQ